jgi:3-deoxy-manno-octulosonate cytidylyltransferase (CMP-KDO synthetase)
VSLRVLAVIPARLGSTRLPRKVLREIAGRPMVARVWDRARRVPALDDVIVATDADEVQETCTRLGIPCMMTSAAHRSGTDRVWEVAQARDADVYVNIQGDEPLVSVRHIDALVSPFHAEPGTQVTTLCIQATPDEVLNPNAVKVVVGAQRRALYFSRHAIPYDRAGAGVARFKHIGLYAFRRDALETFHRLSASPLEHAEQLEQLRLLEHGIPIVVTETDEPTIGVDTEDDLRAVEALLAAERS